LRQFVDRKGLKKKRRYWRFFWDYLSIDLSIG
jgi:hypothetical protein